MSSFEKKQKTITMKFKDSTNFNCELEYISNPLMLWITHEEGRAPIAINQDLALELAQVLLNFAESGELNEVNNV